MRALESLTMHWMCGMHIQGGMHRSLPSQGLVRHPRCGVCPSSSSRFFWRR